MDNALIRKLGRFTKLSHDDKALLTRIVSERVRRFLPKEDIIIEDAKPNVMFLALSGWASRYKVLEDGRRQIMALFLPGDLCDLNVFVLKKMDHSIAALTPVSIAEITREAYAELMAAYPRVVTAMWWENLVAAAIQREWAMNLGQRDAAERMAHLFCELFHRLKAVGLTVQNSIEMPLTQAELGEVTGLTSVHVNRVLQELRTANLIVLKSRVLTIPDLTALEASALFNPSYLHLDHEGSHLDANA